MKDLNAIVLSNKSLTDTLFLMTLRCGELARNIRPGQFVHISIPTLQANILRRPFSVYDADPESETIDILYQVVGEGTRDMSHWIAGYLTDMIAPIGNAWQPPENCTRALLVGGGVGAAPLYMLCADLLSRGIEVDVVLGAVTKDALVCHGRYLDISPSGLHCTTDDGTYGTRGFATLEAARLIEESRVSGKYDYAAVCGPEPLMRSVCEMTLSERIETQVSLERRMACGVGACLSCVVETVAGKRRACVDGPIFSAAEVIWQ